MVKKIDDLNFYELLEVDLRATSQEIHKAYERVRRIYEPNSIALYSLFSPKETEKLHQRVEEAYRTLIYEENRRKYDATLRERHDLPEMVTPAPRYQPRMVPPPVSRQEEQRSSAFEAPAQPAPVVPPARTPETVQLAPSSIIEFSGSVLKVLREQRGLTIRNVADITKVGSRYLEYIEAEHFQKLPARPYLRGFLTLLAKALGYESDRIVNDYLKRYDAAMGQPR